MAENETATPNQSFEPVDAVAGFEALLEKHGDTLDVFDPETDQGQQTAGEDGEDRAAANAAARAEDDDSGDGSDDRDADASAGEDSDDEGDDDDAARAAGDDPDEDDGDADDSDAELEVADVAFALGLDEDQFDVSDDGQLLVLTKVDGVAEHVTLDALRTGYQRQEHVTKREMEVADHARQLTQEHAQRSQRVTEALTNAETMIEALKARVVTKYEGTDWALLRQQDPAEYAARQAELQNEMRSLNAEVYALQQTREAQQAEEQEASTKEQEAWLAEQKRLGQQHLPDLWDPEKQPGLLKEYHEYLSGRDFTDEEIKNTLDARYLRVIDDAVKYRKLMAEQQAKGEGDEGKKKALVKKKVLRSPRIAKRGGRDSGQRDTSGSRRGGRKAQALRKLRETGTAADAVAFIEQSSALDALM